jgi:two-component system, OmpR family, phosphate regulon sensor histidine kinase PhoR
VSQTPARSEPRGPAHWSLRGQLILAFVGVILVAMVPLAAFVPWLARAYQLTALENRLADEAQLVADYVTTVTTQSPAPSIPATSSALPEDEGATRGTVSIAGGLGAVTDLDGLAKRLGARTDTRITIIAPDGQVVGESHQDLAQVGNHATRREVQQALARGRGVDRHRSETVGYEMLYVAVPIERDGAVIGVARAALPLSEVDRFVGALAGTILLAAVGAGLLALAVALYAARVIARPLARLSHLASALADDPAHRGRVLAGGGPAEVVALGVTLDRLAGAVQSSLERLRTERDRLDAVLANLAAGVVMIDSRGRVRRLNPAAEQLLGMTARAAGGRTVAEVLRDHELVALVERARTSDVLPRVATGFVEWHRPPRLLRAGVTRFGQGPARQTLLVLQDLTELRRLETIRRDFVANVSHELRTPIAAIKAMVETLQDGAVNDPADARDFLARIEQETDGLHQLVEELLELSRLESGRVALERVPIAPAQLVQTAVRRLAPLARRARVTLDAAAEPELPPVLADPERMGQVLVGVIHNAIKFTPPEGRIVIGAAAAHGWVDVSVADSGVGIEPDELSRIFERFYKARQRAPAHTDAPPAVTSVGTGLGLAIAKHTVQLHSGTIWAESPGPGRGTIIHMTLPVANQPPATGAAPLAAPLATR